MTSLGYLIRRRTSSKKVCVVCVCVCVYICIHINIYIYIHTHTRIFFREMSKDALYSFSNFSQLQLTCNIILY